MSTEEKGTTKLLLNKKTSKWLYQAGIAIVTMSALLLLILYYPVIKEEVRYQLARSGKIPVVTMQTEKPVETSAQEKIIIPVDEDYGIVIPKISANSKVIADVDWQNSLEYQRALTRGVAQAKGTAKPGEAGNVFIFAHSGIDIYEATRYNAVFYLISKLEPGDEITVFYQKVKYVYRVAEKKEVAADRIEYLEGDEQKKTLTLMTCWPPGTTWKRLVVVADQVE